MKYHFGLDDVQVPYLAYRDFDHKYLIVEKAARKNGAADMYPPNPELCLKGCILSSN